MANHSGYGVPLAAGGPVSSQRSSAMGGSSIHAPSLGGVLSLLFAAVAIAVVFHLLGVRFFVEVRRG